MPRFSREELTEAFATFEATVAEAARTRDWDAWVGHYTPDVDYIEHAMGTMKGRDEVRAWITRTMGTFPGSYMTEFPSLWSVIDEDTGRVICELDNPMRDPGDGTIISATNISIVTYAGDGLWSRQEDIYNPLRFLQAGMKWCKKAREAGHPRRRGRRVDAASSEDRSERPPPKLVIGANGFLGSHVTRQLVADGHQVRVMVRENANTVAIDDLDVQRFVGDIWDDDTLREAMAGCDDVYYCVVDTRGWLRDPAPLFRTNVEGTRNVLDVALEFPGSLRPAPGTALHRFIFTSSYVTVGRRRGRTASETDVIADRGLTPYVRSRVQAEELVLRYARETGLPAIAMCVSTTYGSGDWGRTPHGAIIAGAAFGKLPFVMGGIDLEAVGVDDAARAMILAAERGRIGERYLISEKMISNAEVARIAAEAAGVAAARQGDPAADVLRAGDHGHAQGAAAPAPTSSCRWTRCG